MTPATPETLQVAQAAFQDFAHGLANKDWGPFLAHLSDDFTFWFPTGPFKGQNTGKARAKAFFESVSQVFPDGLNLTLERTLSDGNTILFEVRSHGIIWGNDYDNQAAISFDIAGDKVCAYREYLGVIYKVDKVGD